MPYVVSGNKHLSVKAPTTTALLLAAARPNRTSILIQNIGVADVYLGNSDVTASGSTRGILLTGNLSPASTLTDTTTLDAWYAITASGTADVTVCEVYP